MKLRHSVLLLLSFFLNGLFCYAQQNESINRTVDSLRQILKHVKQDSAKGNILNAMIEAEDDDEVWPRYNDELEALARRNLTISPAGHPQHTVFLKLLAAAISNKGYLAHMQGNIPTALAYYEQGLALDKEAGNKQGVATSLNNMGSLYQYQGQITKALDYYKRSMALRAEIKDKQGLAESYNNLALIYNEQGDIPASLNSYHKGLKIQEEINDKKGIAISLNNIGYVYQQQDDTARALAYYERSLKIQKEIGDLPGMAGSLHNIGHIYFSQSNVTKALEYFTASLKLSEQTGSKPGMAHCFSSLGAICNSRSDLQGALYYWRKSLKLYEEVGDKQGMSLSLNHLATVLSKLGQAENARHEAERSLQLAQELGFPGDIKTASGSLSEIYIKTGDWKKAYAMLALYKQMSDSIYKETSRKAALQKSFQYEYEKKAAADSIKTTEQRKVFDAQLQQQKIQRTALYTGIGLITLFALFMYNRFRLSQKQKQIIELKEKETQHQKDIIEEKHKEIQDSINYAGRIQRSFLATKELLDKHLKDYFILFKPKAIVSGDFYWVAELNNGQFAIAVADSTGHGVPGAIMSLLNITSLEKAVEHLSEPATILDHTRSIIIERLKKDGSPEGGKDGMDCCLMVFDFKNNRMTYAAANNPIWIIRGNQLIELPPDKMPVGKHSKETTPFTQHPVEIKKGDVVYALTDGLPDQFGGPRGKKFMYKQLKELLTGMAHLSMATQQERLVRTLQQWQGDAEQVDDITLIGIRV